MTPHDYAESVVLPTVREFLAERGNLRRAILTCVTTYHLIDYLALALCPATSSKSAARKAREAEADQIRDKLRSICAPALEIVQGICNGTKHADPVSTQAVPPFAFGVAGAGWGQGRWEYAGLQVEHDGQKMFVDGCVQAVLLTLRAEYNTLVDPLDLTFFDVIFRGQPGWIELDSP